MKNTWLHYARLNWRSTKAKDTGKLKAFEERIKLRKGGQAESQDNLLFAQGEHSGKGRRFSKRGGRSNFSRGNWQNSRRGNSNHKGNSTRNKGEWDLSKSNLILEDDEPSLLMTTHEEVLLNEGQIQPGKYASGDAIGSGCTAYAKITIPHLKKLDDRSIPIDIYLGVRGRINSKMHENSEVGDLLLMEEEPRNYKEAIQQIAMIRRTLWIPVRRMVTRKYGHVSLTQLTRPDLSYSVGLLTAIMQDPRLSRITGLQRQVVIDSTLNKEKETTRKYFTLESHLLPGVTRNNQQWRSHHSNQEFMAATGAACQALWLKRLLSELTGREEERITLKVDNISAIALVRNPVFHGRSKHID
ncbi:zinc finger, CCHC-type containing protein [Tanacetum coccineum]